MTVNRITAEGDVGTLTRGQFDRIRATGIAEAEERSACSTAAVLERDNVPASEITLDELRRRIYSNSEFEKAVDTMQQSGWSDDQIVRIILGDDAATDIDRPRNAAEKIVELLRDYRGEIRFAAGAGVEVIANLLRLAPNTVRQALEDLDRRGIVVRDVTKQTGTTRVALVEGDAA